MWFDYCRTLPQFTTRMLFRQRLCPVAMIPSSPSLLSRPCTIWLPSFQPWNYLKRESDSQTTRASFQKSKHGFMYNMLRSTVEIYITASNDGRSISPLQKPMWRNTYSCAKIGISPTIGSRSGQIFHERPSYIYESDNLSLLLITVCKLK